MTTVNTPIHSHLDQRRLSNLRRTHHDDHHRRIRSSGPIWKGSVNSLETTVQVSLNRALCADRRIHTKRLSIIQPQKEDPWMGALRLRSNSELLVPHSFLLLCLASCTRIVMFSLFGLCIHSESFPNSNECKNTPKSENH